MTVGADRNVIAVAHQIIDPVNNTCLVIKKYSRSDFKTHVGSIHNIAGQLALGLSISFNDIVCIIRTYRCADNGFILVKYCPLIGAAALYNPVIDCRRCIIVVGDADKEIILNIDFPVIVTILIGIEYGT